MPEHLTKPSQSSQEKLPLINCEDELLNQNAWEYLKLLTERMRDDTTLWFGKTIPNKSIAFTFNQIREQSKTYSQAVAYGDLRRDFLVTLEQFLSTATDSHKEYLWQQPEWRAFIDLLYANPNKSLERSAAVITTSPTPKSPKSPTSSTTSDPRAFRKTFPARTEPTTSRNHYLPREVDSPKGSIKAAVGRNVNNTVGTNIPQIRDFAYQKGKPDSQELRVGTQVETRQGKARLFPLFSAWLRGQKAQIDARPTPRSQSSTTPSIPPDRITHVYFNLLPQDLSLKKRLTQKREQTYTRTLHASEKQHDNLAVITLPANAGPLSQAILEQRETISTRDAIRQMQALATGKSRRVQDFYISDAIKQILYKEKTEDELIYGLIVKSFNAIGIKPDDQNALITGSQLHAVSFHFLKYELPNFILKTLQPQTFNMTCKDAIDRGGVASLYFNFIKSMEAGPPLTEQEFNTALYGPAMQVKGRLIMNHQARFLWNAIDRYIQANDQKNLENSVAIPDYLRAWRNANHPALAGLYKYLEKKEHEKTAQEKKRHDRKYSRFSRFFTGESIKQINEKISKTKEIIETFSKDLHHRQGIELTIESPETMKSLFKICNKIAEEFKKSGHVITVNQPILVISKRPT